MRAGKLPLLLVGFAVVLANLDGSTARAQTEALASTSNRLAAWSVYDARLADLESQVHELANGQGNKKSACAGEPSLYAGFSFLFAKAHMKESFEATITNPVAGSLTLVPLDNDYELTPRVWLGATNEAGLGVRVSYWNYDHAGNSQAFVANGTTNLPGATVTTVIFPATIIAAVPGDVLTTNNRLETTTLDAEGTIDLEVSSLQIRAGGGLRYARINQQMSAEVTGIGPARLDWTREYEGLGPTISANVRRPLWERFAVIGALRGSLLFGEKSLQRVVVNDVSPTPAPPIVQLNDADGVTAAFELALGAEWTYELDSGHQLIAQGTYEGQLWTDAGAPTLTFLGFEGFSASLGIIW